MIPQKLETALNDQITAEIFSAYLYLSMATYFDTLGLKGFAHWMVIQAKEELTHAQRIFQFISERGGRITLNAIEQPQNEWASPKDVFENAYEHEKMITGRINSLVDLAIQEKDHATNNFLQWFVNEQVEEESSVEEVIHKLKLIGDSGNGLFMIEQELGQRTFLPPTDLTFIW